MECKARCHVGRGLTEAIAVISLVAEQVLGWRQARQHQRAALVITHLFFGQQQDQWSAFSVADSVQLGVQAAFGAADTAGDSPLFEQAGRRSVRLEVSGVNHQAIRLTGPSRQPGEDAVEDSEAAPADEAVVERLMRAVVRGRITPTRPIADDMKDATDHTLVVHPRHPVREREIGVIRRICAFVS
jgi:hypothetical protein